MSRPGTAAELLCVSPLTPTPTTTNGAINSAENARLHPGNPGIRRRDPHGVVGGRRVCGGARACVRRVEQTCRVKSTVGLLYVHAPLSRQCRILVMSAGVDGMSQTLDSIFARVPGTASKFRTEECDHTSKLNSRKTGSQAAATSRVHRVQSSQARVLFGFRLISLLPGSVLHVCKSPSASNSCLLSCGLIPSLPPSLPMLPAPEPPFLILGLETQS